MTRQSGQGFGKSSSEPDLPQLFAAAVQWHQQQQFDLALNAYQQVLQCQPNHVDALINLGSLWRRLGKNAEAIASYQTALQINPERPEVWFNLGNVLQAQQESEPAIAAYQQALQLQPHLTAAHVNLGKLWQKAGNFDQAYKAYQQAIAQSPELAIAQMNLGNVCKSLGLYAEAIAHHRCSVALQPQSAEAHYNLANALQADQQSEAAIAAYQQSIQLKPNFAPAHLNLAGALEAVANLPAAIESLERAIAVQPDLAEAHFSCGKLLYQQADYPRAEVALRQAWQLLPNQPLVLTHLALALQAQGKDEDAISLLEAELQQQPDQAHLHCNLGSLFNDLGRWEQAVIHLRQAVELDPSLAMGFSNLGYALNCQSQLTEAIAICQQAIDLNPELAAAHLNQGYAFTHQAQHQAAAACFERILSFDPDSHPAHSNRLYLMNYTEESDPRAIAAAHRTWGSSRGIQPALTWANPRQPERCLRVGYLSPDFRQHSVAYFIEPVLLHHDRSQVEPVCYSQTTLSDAVTERLRGLVPAWHEVHAWDDDRLAEQIRADQIDILVDLAGHTAQNRLLTLARQPAPVQITYLGYPNTTGLETIHYRLTDAWADPPGQTEAYHTETLLRLPRSFLCYQPPAHAPAVSVLPANTMQRITFGSFNNLAKITPAVIALWSEILKAVPNSRLVIKMHSLDDLPTRDRYQDQFVQQGIDPRRIKLIGVIPDPTHHLAFYGNLDIALDPFPYNGTTTTCEALWMGVPVITLAGATHVSRVGVSLLNAVGLPNLIAATPAEYVAIAVALATDWAVLAKLRANLRQEVATSLLCDAVAHTQAIEAAYRQCWQTYCQAKN